MIWEAPCQIYGSLSIKWCTAGFKKKKKSSVMENISKKIKKKVTKQSTHCISIWYKNNVFYWHIFVISSFIPTEPERVGGITKQIYCYTSHMHTCTHTNAHTHEGGWDQGIGFLFSLSIPKSSSGLNGACNLGVLGDVVVWNGNTLDCIWSCLSRRLGLFWLRICLQCRRPGINLWVRKIPWNGNPFQYSCLGNPIHRESHG